MGQHKTVLFGLDGACWDLLDRWLAGGCLPTIASLVERGGRARLESCVPATTPPAWTSLTTGTNPGKHGVFGFYSRQRDTYNIRPVSDQDVHARRIWDYTSKGDLTSIVLNVPVTHPVRPLDGVLVPGYLAPGHPRTYPESILEDVGHSEYRIYAPSEAEDVPDDRLREEWLQLTKSRAELARSLCDAYDWDLLLVEFQKTDGAVHKFSDHEDVRAIYECVDECIGRVLAAVNEPVNVFIVSDHGIGKRKDWAISLNTWLKERGYLRTSADAGIEKRDWLSDATDESDATDDESDASGGTSDVNDRATDKNPFASLGLTRHGLERLLSKLGLYDLARCHAPEWVKNTIPDVSIDRPNSTAFYEGMGFSGVDVGVILNERSFYDEGTVGPEEYDNIRDALIKDLETLSGPAGPVFSEVNPREQIYCGERIPYAPDIILEQADPYVIGSTTPRGKTFIETEAGRIDHTRTGLLVAAGPDVETDWTLRSTASILDVTPTLLHLLGCPLSKRFDGAVLSTVLETEREERYESYDPYTPSDAYSLSEEERDSLEDRLTQLGYLE